MSWQDDLGYIREVGPDEPKFRAAVKRVWDRLATFDKIATLPDKLTGDDEGWPTPAPLPPDYWESAE